MRFIWDDNKNQVNQIKHHVSFEVAARILADPLAFVEPGSMESDKNRWQALGQVDGLLLLIVAQTVWIDLSGSKGIRMISARRATEEERMHYERNGEVFP